MRHTCHWCTKTATGSALTYENNQRPSCGSHGRRNTFTPYPNLTTTGDTMDNDSPLEEWEMELLHNHTSRKAQPARYRVSNALGSVVGTYTEEQYQAMLPLIRDLNKMHGRRLDVVRLDAVVVTTTVIETKEVQI